MRVVLWLQHNFKLSSSRVGPQGRIEGRPEAAYVRAIQPPPSSRVPV